MTTTTPTIKTPAVQQPVNGHVNTIAPKGITPSLIFNSGVEQFISMVEAMIADDNTHWQDPLSLPESLLFGVESAYTYIWPILMDMVKLLRHSQRGRTPQDNEKFHQLAVSLARYLCYAEGAGAVERAAHTATYVTQDSHPGFSAN